MSEFQLHLASKVTIPEVLAADGKTVKTKAREIVSHGMSNRVVRVEQLEPDQIDKINLDAAKMAGAEATGREVFMLQRTWLLHHFVKAYTDPTDDPTAAGKKWIKANPNEFNDPTGKGRWSKIFTAKDTAFLQAEYSKWHDMPGELVEILSGKGIHVASEG